MINIGTAQKRHKTELTQAVIYSGGDGADTKVGETRRGEPPGRQETSVGRREQMKSNSGHQKAEHAGQGPR